MQTIVRSEKKLIQRINYSLLDIYLYIPLKKGLIGFSSIFLILLLSKTVSHAIGLYNPFIIDIGDFFLALTGSVFQITIYFLKRYSTEKDKIFLD